MPKFVELGHTGVIHESEIFGAVMPPRETAEDAAEDAEIEEAGCE